MQDDVPLSLQPEPHGRAVIVRLVGELNACSGSQLGARLERLLSQCGLQFADCKPSGKSAIRNPQSAIQRVVLDLSQARVQDAPALLSLLCAHQRLELLGCQLLLCDVPAVTLGMLTVLGVAAHLTILDRVTAQALLEAFRTEI